jgi:hypothetical protein
MTKTFEVEKICYRNVYWEVNCNEDIAEILPHDMLGWLYSFTYYTAERRAFFNRRLLCSDWLTADRLCGLYH